MASSVLNLGFCQGYRNHLKSFTKYTTRNEKPCKIGQYQETLISVFSQFLISVAKNSFLRDIGDQALTPPNFENLLVSPIHKILVLIDSSTLEATRTQGLFHKISTPAVLVMNQNVLKYWKWLKYYNQHCGCHFDFALAFHNVSKNIMQVFMKSHLKVCVTVLLSFIK